ncbi:MAG: hypothetical protein ACR2KC_00020 [Acidimicrobiales bacterium]
MARYVVGLGLAGVAAWAVAGKSDELSGSSEHLENLRWCGLWRRRREAAPTRIAATPETITPRRPF